VLGKPGDPPTWQYVDTYEHQDDYTGEIAESFSRTDGHLVGSGDT
jgi:hypothetical protein